MSEIIHGHSVVPFEEGVQKYGESRSGSKEKNSPKQTQKFRISCYSDDVRLPKPE